MRTNYLLVVFGLVAACDERSPDERALASQKLPIESTKDVTVDPDPEPDPSVDNRNAPVVEHTASSRDAIDLEHERATLARVIEARIQRVDAAIDALEKRGGAQDAVATLRAKRDQARAKLSELDKTTHDNWIAYERDVYAAWDALQRDVDEATR